MGFFDLLKKGSKAQKDASVTKQEPISARNIPESEKKYYKPDEYYTLKKHEGTFFESSVISFDERKKTCIPSNRGLYVAEILLLEYCSQGDYPRPRNGYPGFWWFEYGVRDVGLVLKSLEQRGFIYLKSIKDSADCLHTSELKKILSAHGKSSSGKKMDLLIKVKEAATEDELVALGVVPKYGLTELGKKELEDNQYVPYMHKCPNKTREDARLGTMFNVWSINQLLGTGDKSNWKEIVDTQERKSMEDLEKSNRNFMEGLKEVFPVEYKQLLTQDQQLEAIKTADAKYKEDKNIDAYISFWENIWSTGGLLFEGVKWHFTLPDLYIKAKRYDDALRFLNKLKKLKPFYTDKANVYITRIEERKAKEKETKKKDEK